MKLSKTAEKLYAEICQTADSMIGGREQYTNAAYRFVGSSKRKQDALSQLEVSRMIVNPNGCDGFGHYHDIALPEYEGYASCRIA